MYKGKKILAIIPARGGSKGLPGKNIKELCGKPLIAWSIEHAQKSKYVDEIFISTDSQEIADVAEQFGAPCPELRPAELARDTAPSSEFIIYTLEKMKKEGKSFDYFILLEPTSPLRDVEDVDKSIEMLVDNPVAESVMGVVRAEDSNPAFMVKIGEGGLMIPFMGKAETMRRQDIPDAYYFEGTVYLSKSDAYMEKKAFYHDKTLPYIVPKWKSFEIDDIIDFTIVEAIMKLKLQGFFD